MRTLLFLVVMAYSGMLQAQDTRVSDYIEGSKVLLEFVKLFKSESVETSKIGKTDCKKAGISDIYFENKRKNTIKVVLIDKLNQQGKQELIIQPEKTEMVLSTLASVYTCEVYEMPAMIALRKGDIKLLPCENPTIEIE